MFLVFVVLIAGLSFNLTDDRSQQWSLRTQLVDVCVSFSSAWVL